MGENNKWTYTFDLEWKTGSIVSNDVVIADLRRSSDALPRLRLMSAAPDLLEALKVCAALIHLQNGNLHQDTNAILEMARLAVVKAEGPYPSENMEG